jgi:nucleotide-binding universal stress UspA family protein
MPTRKILVGTDFSNEAGIALEQAVAIGRRHGAEIVLVNACSIPDQPGENDTGIGAKFERQMRQHMQDSRDRLEELRARHNSASAPLSHAVIDGFPDTAVANLASEISADLVVVGTHGRTGFRRFLLGSVAERVVRLSETNVLVARARREDSSSYRHVLVPTDFSATAERALAVAIDLVDEDGVIDLFHC